MPAPSQYVSVWRFRLWTVQVKPRTLPTIQNEAAVLRQSDVVEIFSLGLLDTTFQSLVEERRDVNQSATQVAVLVFPNCFNNTKFSIPVEYFACFRISYRSAVPVREYLCIPCVQGSFFDLCIGAIVAEIVVIFFTDAG